MKKFTLIPFLTLLIICIFQLSSGAQTIAQAVQNGDTAQLNLLISLGANVNQADSNGTTPLMLSCSLGDTVIAHILINNGANTSAIDSTGETALIISAADGYVDLVNLLLAAGADPKYRINSMRAYDFAIEAKATLLQTETPRNSSINQQAAISSLYTALGY